MDKTLHRFDSLEAMKRDEYRSWLALSPQQRMEAVADLSLAAYQLKEPTADVPRLQRTLIRFQRTAR